MAADMNRRSLLKTLGVIGLSAEIPGVLRSETHKTGSAPAEANIFRSIGVEPIINCTLEKSLFQPGRQLAEVVIRCQSLS